MPKTQSEIASMGGKTGGRGVDSSGLQEPTAISEQPIDTPAENPRSFREVKSAIMPADSQENVDLWWQIFREIDNETAEIQRRQHRNQPKKGA